jgi:prepilin-type N-terminal cleavage/methylation domain-containing protein
MVNSKQQSGFTIVELLIVIVVIGILAAIALVAYNGISNRAIGSALQSDLNGAAKTIENDKTLSSGELYPDTINAVNGGKGFKFSNGANAQYTVDNSTNPRTYCVTATKGSISYYVDQGGSVKAGYCPGHVAPADNNAIVTTIAGTSTAGLVDGAGNAAQLSGPIAIAIDSNGVLYVADADNNVIRKVTTSGVVTTFAGSGTAGSTDSTTGTSAQFNGPRGITVDNSGNVYVADYYNNRIRKITPAGAVSTLAGNTLGNNDGVGTSAQFNSPRGVAADNNGNLYVTDTTNNTIRKIVISTATVTTLAGSLSRQVGTADGVGASARFDDPRGIVLDSATGDMYVTDSRNNLIRKVTTSGAVTTIAGSAAAGTQDGTGLSVRFNEPYGITLGSDGALYVADSLNDRIRKVTTSGVVTTITGSSRAFADGTGTSALFDRPRGIVSAGNKVFYIADTGNNRIRKLQLP